MSYIFDHAIIPTKYASAPWYNVFNHDAESDVYEQIER